MRTAEIVILASTAGGFLALRKWCSRGGGGKFGAKVRASDHDSWRDAVEQQEQYLRELKSREPRQ